jgi:hypothetical protein
MGGVVRPGFENTTGILKVGDATRLGRLELEAGAIMQFRLNGTTAGTDYDQLHLGAGGGILIAGEDSVELGLELGYMYDSQDLVFLIRNDLPSPFEFKFFQDLLQDGDMVNLIGDGGLSGTALISYSGDYATQASSGGNDFVLYDFAVIPEPEMMGAILGAFALLTVVGVRRRRNERAS